MKEEVLHLKRILPAEIRRVFDAWTNADALARWFVCSPEWTATTTNDFRVGGKYRIEMRTGRTLVGVASGEYLEIEAPRRLVFTWTSEGRIGVRDSLVTVELKAVGGKTELSLTHDIAPPTPEGRAHAEGWEACFTSLERYLASES